MYEQVFHSLLIRPQTISSPKFRRQGPTPFSTHGWGKISIHPLLFSTLYGHRDDFNLQDPKILVETMRTG